MEVINDTEIGVTISLLQNKKGLRIKNAFLHFFAIPLAINALNRQSIVTIILYKPMHNTMPVDHGSSGSKLL